MSVLKNIQKLRVPIVSFLLAALLCFTFIEFMKQDEIVWKQLSLQYQEKLLQQELPLYKDFVVRRWEIERLGSQEYLQQLSSYIENHAVDKLSRLILSDHLFYPYLIAEGHVYMSTIRLKALLGKRQQISTLMSRLSLHRFGLMPEHYGASDLVSYIFVDANPFRFVVNFLLFIVLSMFIERRYGHVRLLLLITFSSLGTATTYLLIAGSSAAGLQSSSGVIFGLSAAVLSHIYSPQDRPQGRKKKYALKVIITALIISLLILNVFEEAKLNLATYHEVIAYLAASLLAFLLFALNRHLHRISQENEALVDMNNIDDQAVSSNPKENWKFRVALAKAMALISQFNFEDAREALTVLRRKYPQSALVLEQQYHLEKLQPDDGEYWQCANELIQLSIKKHDYARMKRLFNDIQRNAATKERAKVSLKPDSYHKMMMVFVQHDDLTKAEQAFLFLELAGHTDIIKDACTLLIEEFKVREMTVKKQQYQMLYERLI